MEMENPKEFIEAFISNNLFDLLVNNLFKINEFETTENNQTISDILSTLENLLDVYPFSAKLLGERTKFIEWLYMRIKLDEFDNNKLFASELLSTLIQTSSENQLALARLEAMPILVKILIECRQKKFKGGQEEEFVQNIVDIMCSSLLEKDNQNLFEISDGIRIMIDFLKENNLYRHLSVKILDFATQNNPKNCKDLVENDGLAALFSYFMGKAIKYTKANFLLNENCEEHCLMILTNLCKFLKGVNKDRLIFKFKEKNYEKCERLIELYKKNNMRLKEENLGDDEENEELGKFNSSVFNIQNLSLIICYLESSGLEDINLKMKKLFQINNLSQDETVKTLKEMKSHLGEGFESEDQNYFSVKNFIDEILKNIK